jgi:peptide/nickel transport system permease protein
MRGGLLGKLWDHDLAWSFRRSPVTIAAALLTLACVAGAAFSPWISPQDPFDAAALDLNAAFKPPAWIEGGDAAFVLGTDNQGRDILSTILHGARISLGIGLASVAFALALGVFLGLLAGYFGGRLDALIMRIADVQLSFPAILIALLIDGVARVALSGERHDEIAIPVLVLSIGFAGWVQYARTVRGSTMVERGKEYVQAARVTGRKPLAILLRHVLPNVMGPVLVIATIHIATAIITEATLSFLGVGVPPTQPSLGTLIRVGNEFLYSGEWWIAVFPGAALIVLVLSVNLLGDWLRDALNPKLR